jgi:hypothetical protein
MATARPAPIPAPVGGLNTVSSGLGLPPSDCVQAYNLIAAENGLRVRFGAQEWCTGVTGDSDDTIRTLVPFTGGSSSKLWAASNTGLWDVTDSGSSPARVVTFPSSAGNAGYGVFCTVVSAGGHYLFFADEQNGLYRYAETGAAWTKVGFGGGAGQIAGVDPAHAAFVTVFKGRVWVVERDTDSAWYLPAGAIAGTAVKFSMGMAFRNGGTLLGLWNWTYDGGAGMDDSMVALSTNGDVLIYQGTDPGSSATFALRGTWYAGPPPAGRQVATSDGGELLLLTRQGVLPLSRLVVGGDVLTQATTLKVANLINTLMSQRASSRGWSMIQHPEDAAFLLLVPQGPGDYALQLAQATASKGWFLWRDLDMSCAASWEKSLYYGTSDGRVCRNTGYVDGVTLADPNAFTPIDWSLLTAASDLGSPTQKQVGLIRPLIISEGIAPNFSAEARFGYSLEELDPVSLVAGAAEGWDSGVWDEAVWAGASAPTQEVRGTTGMGSEVAISIRGVAVSRTVLVGISVTYTSGGFL